MTSIHKSDPITQFVLPYNPAYGLANSTRAEVLRLVVDWQVKPAKAAAMYGLHPSTVCRWLADARRLSTCAKKDL